MKATTFENLTKERAKEFAELARKIVQCSSPDEVARTLAWSMASAEVLSDHPELAGVFE